MSGFTGFRGAVSLAAAVAVPRMVESGGAFPERDLIVFVVAGVVVVTIVAQSLVLPAVVRWADFGDSHEVVEERRTAERRALEEALEALPRWRSGPARTPRSCSASATTTRDTWRSSAPSRATTTTTRCCSNAVRRFDLELELVRLKAAALIRMRDDGDIDDLVLRQVRAEYDAEETRLLRQGDRD